MEAGASGAGAGAAATTTATVTVPAPGGAGDHHDAPPPPGPGADPWGAGREHRRARNSNGQRRNHGKAAAGARWRAAAGAVAFAAWAKRAAAPVVAVAEAVGSGLRPWEAGLLWLAARAHRRMWRGGAGGGPKPEPGAGGGGPLAALGARALRACFSPVVGWGVMAAQAATEGVRWQFYPIYTAFGILSTADNFLGCALKRKTVAAVCGVASGLSAALAVAFPVIKLPKPRGRHLVGRVTVQLEDPARPAWVEELEDGPPRRTLMACIWYPRDPAADLAHLERTSFIENKKFAGKMSQSFGFPGFIASHLRLVTANSIRDAPPLRGRRFPVVVFSHGLYSTRMQNTALLEDLVSQGFVCAAVDHPYDAVFVLYPDGSSASFMGTYPEGTDFVGLQKYRNRNLHMRAGDLSFLLDRLERMNATAGHLLCGTMDFGSVSALGHSFGGATAFLASQKDERIGRVMALDPWMWPLDQLHRSMGARVPTVFLESDLFLNDRDLFTSFNGVMSSQVRAASHRMWKVVFHDTGHYEYTDMCWVCPYLLKSMALMRLNRTDTSELYELMNDLVLHFFRTEKLDDARLRASGLKYSVEAPKKASELAGATLTAAQERAIRQGVEMIRRGEVKLVTPPALDDREDFIRQMQGLIQAYPAEVVGHHIDRLMAFAS